MNGLLVFGFVLAWLVILAGSWLGWQLLRQNGRLLLRLDELENRLNELEFGEESREPEGLTVGSEAPVFELPSIAGGRQSLAQFRGQPVLLIFFNPHCGYCRELAPKLAALETERGWSPSAALTHPKEASIPVNGAVLSEPLRTGTVRGPSVLLLTTGDTEKNRQFFAEHKVSCPVLLQNDGEVAKAYQVNGTPAGYLVSAEGKMASNLAIGAAALLKLASEPAPLTPTLSPSDGERVTTGGDGRANRFSQRSIARSKIKRDGLKAGTPAPDFRLPRLDGRGELSLEEFRGRRVLLVFSSPHCGPCDALAPELGKFQREHPELEVVMISKGEPSENRSKVKEHGLTFPVVLQQQWEISRRYAMFATPIAYLIDPEGVIEADVALGPDAILALAGKTADQPVLA